MFAGRRGISANIPLSHLPSGAARRVRNRHGIDSSQVTHLEAEGPIVRVSLKDEARTILGRSVKVEAGCFDIYSMEVAQALIRLLP